LLSVFGGKALADEGGEFQAEAGAVADLNGGVMVGGDDDGVSDREVRRHWFMPMVEKKAGFMMVGLEGGTVVKAGPVVVATKRDECWDVPAQTFKKGEGFVHGGGAIHDIADQDKRSGLMIVEEGKQAVFEFAAAPVRQKSALPAAAQVVAVVEIGDREPALLRVDKSEAVVEPDPGGDGAKSGGFRGRQVRV